MRLISYVTSSLGVILFAFFIAGCGDKRESANTNTSAVNVKAKAPAQSDMPPPEVSIITVSPENILITTELPGRVEATRVAQVRARVPGIILKRVFREGSDVKKGDVLFQIDPTSFNASYNNAQAALAKAEANLAQATLKLQRYQPLVASNAISKQEYDDALTAQKQTAAEVESAKAAQVNARLNLEYATVVAPISGHIGRALVTEGALVGQGEATPLALIQKLDPIYVTLTQSSTDVLRLQRALINGRLKSSGKDQAHVSLVTEDGQAYPETGRLLFSDLAVDESSGAITLRAKFPNPERMLLPGMYVRARLEQGVSDQAITVPQQAVLRGTDGATVLVVEADGKVAARPVKTESVQNNKWVISQGLNAGDRVIVEGLQKAKPGAIVRPVPWQAGAAAANALNAPANTSTSAPTQTSTQAADSKTNLENSKSKSN